MVPWAFRSSAGVETTSQPMRAAFRACGPGDLVGPNDPGSSCSHPLSGLPISLRSDSAGVEGRVRCAVVAMLLGGQMGAKGWGGGGGALKPG